LTAEKVSVMRTTVFSDLSEWRDVWEREEDKDRRECFDFVCDTEEPATETGTVSAVVMTEGAL
jgi:hypothetical protein